jgi:arsenate reductase|tara:strand:+ start:61 stop:411 length:351 start_codon:yes stop_codon:yes gene_type:complete
MNKAFLLHNPRCSKSREALEILRNKNENFIVFLYLEEELEASFLEKILMKLSIKPRQLLRKGEAAYKENNLNDENLSDKKIIELMTRFPKLIERPIFIKNKKAVIGRPPEKVLEII